jgi:hypothetical protein
VIVFCHGRLKSRCGTSDGVVMDVTGVAGLATQMSQQRTADEVDTTVLKKALDSERENAAALLQALPTPPSALPEHVGRNVNVVA